MRAASTCERQSRLRTHRFYVGAMLSLRWTGIRAAPASETYAHTNEEARPESARDAHRGRGHGRSARLGAARKRDVAHAKSFMLDVARRLSTPTQLTDDGQNTYLSALEDGPQGGVDDVMLAMRYGHGSRGDNAASSSSAATWPVSGTASAADAWNNSSSRRHPPARVGAARFTRLTNSCSK